MAKTHANLICKIVDLLRGPYQPNQYGDVILPFTILRRLDCILEPTKDEVLASTGRSSRGWRPSWEEKTPVRIVKNIELPTGLSRFLFRLPIHVYRLNLGGLFGHRLLLLNHTGRVTGQPRQVALEVADHDATDGSYVVASGWGTGSAWYRNILAKPDVTIQVGTRTIPVRAVPLTADEGAEISVRFASRHRLEARYFLPWMLGLAVDGSEADYEAMGRHLPFVRFVPRS